MIGRLTGKLEECTPGRVLLDVGGVGYELQIPLSTFYSLGSAVGAVVRVEVHTHVREDALQLFGFATREERGAFELLIAISGVGPKLALAILSGIGTEDLVAAVRRQDRERLQRIPGIGKKTAERLILELRDKMGDGGAAVPATVLPAAAPSGPGGPLRDDAFSALVNLGYSREVAERAVVGAYTRLGPQAELQALLRAALGGLAG